MSVPSKPGPPKLLKLRWVDPHGDATRNFRVYRRPAIRSVQKLTAASVALRVPTRTRSLHSRMNASNGGVENRRFVNSLEGTKAGPTGGSPSVTVLRLGHRACPSQLKTRAPCECPSVLRHRRIEVPCDERTQTLEPASELGIGWHGWHRPDGSRGPAHDRGAGTRRGGVPFPGARSAFAAEHEIPRAYDSYERLFADEDVDVVYIGTPIATHAELAERALAAGKHVLVEKTFATTAEVGAQGCRCRPDLRPVPHGGHVDARFNPAIVQLLGDVAAGVIGEVRTVQASVGISLPQTSNIWRPELGGGALLDLGVYAITLAQLLLGEPEELHAVGDMRADGLDITDSAFLRYGNERFAQVVTSIAGWVNPVASIGGTAGFIGRDGPFWSSGGYRVETPFLSEPRTVRVELEGNGFVPMFRAVSRVVVDGLLETPWAARRHDRCARHDGQRPFPDRVVASLAKRDAPTRSPLAPTTGKYPTSISISGLRAR